jgi:hypothetical protein
MRRARCIVAAAGAILLAGCGVATNLGRPPLVGPPAELAPSKHAAEPAVTTARIDTTRSYQAIFDSLRVWRDRRAQRAENEEQTIPRMTPARAESGGTAAVGAGAAAGSGSAGAGLDSAQSAATPSDSLTRAASTADTGSVGIAPAVSVDLPASARARLEAEARRNMAAADSLAADLGRHHLPAHDREKLDTAHGLVRQAREALRRGDLQAAANLAHKARLLAAEVAQK